MSYRRSEPEKLSEVLITIERPITDVVAIVNAYNRERLQKLHQLLIEPIAHLLPKNETDRIMFIPHQELFLVPFTALQDEAGNYLGLAEKWQKVQPARRSSCQKCDFMRKKGV